MLEQLKDDLNSIFARDPAARNLFEVLTTYPGVHALIFHRASHALWQRDFTGSSGLFGFVLKRGTRQQLGTLLDDLDHFGIGFSWGGFESLALPVKIDGCRSVTTLDFVGPIVRLSIGLEDPGDLIADLAAGLARYEALF
jgi:cystathionine beta-lyase